MADPQDAAVSRAIQRVQDALDDLKALQGKDSQEPTDLREAAGETRRRFAQARSQQDAR